MNIVEVTTTQTVVEVTETSATVDVVAGQDTVLVNPPDMAFMCAFDTTEQAAASPTQTYKIKHNSTDGNYAIVNIDGTFTFQRRGTYLINFSTQHQNTTTNYVDVNVFVKKNGQVVPATNSKTTVEAKHGRIPGHMIMAVSFLMFFDVNETFELWWQSANPGCTLHTVAAVVSPEIPVSPSILTTIVQVA